MQFNAAEISKIIKERINQFKIENDVYDEGKIISVNDGIIVVYGLENVMQGEMIALPNKKYAIVLNLERDVISAAVMGDHKDLTEGMIVKSTGRVLEVPVGKNLLGRVVNALGSPIDGKGDILSNNFSPIEKIAPGVIHRQSVNQPIQTGYKAIDTMIPIGKGQRELIIGDRQTGKTTIAIDTIINQRDTGVKCIYVSIGQKSSTISSIVRILENFNALTNTIIVVASAAESATLQYLAPYSGCSMGEYFRDIGEDALIVYDDLSKQAVAYRQISLLLRRPPGREAFPGDVFYLHSRLLERAACVNAEYISFITKGKIKNKTGSLTALPIIETQSGDVSSFIPTNVISITDGQIFLETDLFNSGIRPAINPGISVSRVGGAAQTEIIKKLSSSIRTSLAQYRELAAFAQFSSDLDESTRNQIDYGKKITEILKQKQYSSMSVADQSIILFAAKYNFLSNIEIKNLNIFEKKLLKFFKKNYFSLVNEININGKFNKKVENDLKIAFSNFKENNFFNI